MSRHRNETFTTLGKLGFSASEAATLVRASATLHTWAEHECNGVIQRDEKTGRPYWYSTHDGRRLGPTSDREAGALERARNIAMARGFMVYQQGDPRGCALYLYRSADLAAFAARMGEPRVNIESCYNSIGTAICP